ncbi:hypothetical protein PBI_SPORTO_6 [Arthrobacter phage Sporto]|nr:hypothetical protein PBI_SPORTO_6 [Arthrobacter phage Sporto]
MRWGKRKAPSYDKSVKTYGGGSPHRNLSASPKSIDAQKSRNYQQRVKAAGTDALSTKELKALVERQNLEAQYSRLNPAPVSLGSKIVGELLPAVGGAVWGQMQSRQPQSEPTPVSTAIAMPRSKKSMAIDIVVAAGKQVVAEQGLNIGMAIVKNLLK